MSALSLVQSLTGLGEEMEAEYDEAIDQEVPSPEALAVILAAIRDARAGLAVLYGKVESGLISSAGEKRFVVPGMGEVEIRRNTKRNQWDNEGLTRRVVALALDERVLDEDSGVYEPAHEAVARVLSECARPSWRVTPLRARGLDVDEWCHTEANGWSVQLPPTTNGAGR